METLDTQKFQSIKEIADMTIKISEAKATLKSIEDTKDEYLSVREKEVEDKINKILIDSEEILTSARKNFNEVHNLLGIVSSYKEFLDEGYVKFSDMLVDFNKRNTEWNVVIEKENKQISEMKREIDEDRKSIERQKKDNQNTILQIAKDKKVIESRQAQIKVALEVLNKKQNG